ncbi:hemolysin III family protein [soil metagenome]
MLSVAALVLMVAAAEGDALKGFSAALFGAALVVLYLSSTLYHLVTTPRLKAFFQMLDHASIFLLIAGSYTPLALVGLGGGWGWGVFGVIWALALGGVTLKGISHGRGRLDSRFSTALYVAMGWLVVLVFGRVLEAVPPGGIWLLVAGGLSYTGGIAFFAWHRLTFNHAIWHLCVLAGSVCHVLATLIYIM